MKLSKCKMLQFIKQIPFHYKILKEDNRLNLVNFEKARDHQQHQTQPTIYLDSVSMFSLYPLNILPGNDQNVDAMA